LPLRPGALRGISHLYGWQLPATAPFITPSAAYGLLLNVAGVEMRHDDGESPMTLIKGAGLPAVEIALGALSMPQHHTVYQQLHNYPVGATGAERAPMTQGNKYNIAPVRRAFLSGIKGYVCLRGDAGLEGLVMDGLKGRTPHRYGLPFLGDNNFLPDRIEEAAALNSARWWVPVPEGATAESPATVSRFTVAIDRADMSRTRSKLFQLTEESSLVIPDEAWVPVAYP
jgi:CRISPR-associated protein Cas5t